jgi:thiosulfate dehydrogenase
LESVFKVITAFILGLLAVPGGVYLYLNSGAAPVATSDGMMPFELRLSSLALHARLRREEPKTIPIKADEAAYLAGARVYREDCAMCHGLPGQPPPTIAKGMFPDPPPMFALYEGRLGQYKGRIGLANDPPGEIFWKTKNGIRLSGMPAFRATLSDEQVWQLSVLLAHADKLSRAVHAALAAPPEKCLAPAGNGEASR